ncbi:MAG: hypothetical protein ACYTJ0_01210 [Planctomycetota bacterium]|jgi:hypothetical protein
MMRIAHLIGGVAAATCVAAVILGAGPDEQRELTVRPQYVPASQVISFDDTVGLLDTTTGAIYRLEGSLANPSAQMSWRLRIPPPREASSGVLEIQRATFNHPEATFLVDIVRGTTWILRRRGPERGTWERVVHQ